MGNSGRALDSFRRADSVPDLTTLYTAREGQRIPQMSYLFLAHLG
jgi:hypothetical protein